MTWAELLGVLRGRGLIQADATLQAEAGVGAVVGVAYDSRQVQRGDVFVALKGQRADGTQFALQAIKLCLVVAFAVAIGQRQRIIENEQCFFVLACDI